VKNESSQLAARSFDKDGKPLFDKLVFDEAYMINFRRLFLNAQSEIMLLLPDRLIKTPSDDWFDENNFNDDKDFVFFFLVNSNTHLFKMLDIKIQEYIDNSIMYQWLQTKHPDIAVVYAQNMVQLKDDIKRFVARIQIDGRDIRRYPSFP
jgi:hypothetical protein